MSDTAVSAGDRIAQLILEKVHMAPIRQVEVNPLRTYIANNRTSTLPLVVPAALGRQVVFDRKRKATDVLDLWKRYTTRKP